VADKMKKDEILALFEEEDHFPLLYSLSEDVFPPDISYNM